MEGKTGKDNDQVTTQRILQWYSYDCPPLKVSTNLVPTIVYVLGIDNCASSTYRTPKESVSSFHWIPEKLRFSSFLVSKILKKGQFLAFDFQGRKMSYYNNQQPPVGVPPPQGYPPKDAYPPPGYPPQGYPPPQQGYPPQGYPPQGYAPQYAQPPPRQDNTTGCLEGW
ncbi:hypothetical protein FEM48_Zijuj08G0130500 [Ziziphus jujuba var. spinosa]|uniref:Rhodopsin n=1 Tax=Ziziphus jujuba var. spinosa TaxID=714518 RepID=A0A978UZ94_ZIZJJ|nr:hypothetical protein FEM48_Zijuj08G0130500 [Ziziphus jujuba var. spinosa]